VFARLIAGFSRFVARCVPSPFAFALLLTAVAFAAALFVGRPPEQELAARALDLVHFWFGREKSPGGFTSSGGFAFALQMCLVLATGHALASAPPVARALRRLAALPSTEPRAAFAVALVALLTAWLNWGFGLVAASLFAREVYRAARERGERWAYPVFGAAAYAGLMVWHGGLSGSAPLTVAQSSHDFSAVYGTIPTSRTLFSPVNLALNAVFLAGIPPLFAWLAASRATAADRGKVWELPGDRPAPPEPEGSTAAEQLDHARPLALWIVLLAFGGLAALVARRGLGGSISLPSVIVFFLGLGVLLHGSPARYSAAFASAGSELSGILLQFPFYYGILGILAESGLGSALAAGGTSLSRSLAEAGLPLETAYSWITFAQAGVLNLFVPSGGGQWAVQGGIAGQTALDLGIDPARAVMLVAYGDEYTNMVQPFWALALLSITGLRAREILTYSVLLFVAALPVYLGILALF
jgi:short-chain fatty acids transporter